MACYALRVEKKEKPKEKPTPWKKKKQQTFAEIAREYGLDEGAVRAGKSGLRYSNPFEKGICWYWFARYIRKRDAKKFGRCIACNREKTFEELQCGHFAPAGSCGLDLLMDERNCNGECEGCNAFDDMHLLGYADNLDRRYGEGTSAELRRRYEGRHSVTVKIPTYKWLDLARVYRNLYEEL